MNDKVYIHEFIDVIGHNRARYMHHMTANWCPIGAAERAMSCYGVWATMGSTGRWPEVVNLWELPGWDGLAANFAHELQGHGLQDPSLAEWWAVAAELRRGGVDRILVPAPWTPTIAEHLAAGNRGAVYAHELVTLPPGRAGAYLELLAGFGRDAMTAAGATPIGGWRVAMRNGSEAIALWAFPDLETWAHCEQSWDRDPLARWHASLVELGALVERTLLVDAPLGPLRIGRQPAVEDRRPLSEI